jgi:lambda repressor-like predicted transcriptional regulator
MLRQKAGATMTEFTKKTGLQAHSVRLHLRRPWEETGAQARGRPTTLESRYYRIAK